MNPVKHKPAADNSENSAPRTLAEAQSANGEIRAGGTDLMERLHHHISGGEIVDISRIAGLDQIVENSDGSYIIGTLVTIDQVAKHQGMMGLYPGLQKAAAALANPQIRRAASMGGALLQRNRCWYYRHEEFTCFKKGGNTCPMREGNHQYGVCFDLGPCVSPHPSTLGMALLAYDAEIEVFGKGKRNIAELYGDGRQATSDHLLAAGEILTAIHLPKQPQGETAAYFRSISRARAEWPLVEVLVKGNSGPSGSLTNVRVVMGGVANIPLALPKVDAYLNGRSPSQEMYAEAGRIAAEGANPLKGTAYKVELVANTVAVTIEMAFSNFGTD
jgi:xanthine dehydrogenase YagS FAD-binding subunit